MNAAKTNSKPMNTMLLVGTVMAIALATAAYKTYAQPALLVGTAQALEVLRKRYNLPALAVVVVKDGKICDRVVAGNRKAGDPTLVGRIPWIKSS